MKIPVEHRVPLSKGHEKECLYGENYICRYHTFYNRTDKRKSSKCRLFDEILSSKYRKCKSCLKAIRQQDICYNCAHYGPDVDDVCICHLHLCLVDPDQYCMGFKRK